MTPIHGETDILRRLRNVEARTQMAKSQKPKAKWPKAKSQKPKAKWPKEQLMHDTNTWRDRHPEKIKKR